MSVIVIGRFQADPKRLQQAFVTHKKLLEGISADSKTKGAIHHQFAAGSGEVLVVDEWPDEASFQSFFAGQQDIPKFVAEVGVTAPPVFEFYQSLESPDRF